MDIELGTTVTDRITGFKGVVTGRVNYISGCDQALVAPKVGTDGAFKESQWFDVQRLTAEGAEPVIALDNSLTPGADAPAPRR